MKHKDGKRELKYGREVIDRAGLPSAAYIEAHNLWRSVIFLRQKLDHYGISIDEVEPEDIIDWV